MSPPSSHWSESEDSLEVSLEEAVPEDVVPLSEKVGIFFFARGRSICAGETKHDVCESELLSRNI